jgi:hypothetical protein
VLVDGGDDFYLRVACDFVHLIPVCAGMLGEGQGLEDYVWSSFPEYLKPPVQRVGWLRVERLFGELGIRRDNSWGRIDFLEIMVER